MWLVPTPRQLMQKLMNYFRFQRLRLKALKYLGILPGFLRYDVLHPYKSTVVRQLGFVLDDPKRAVRKEAVDTRYDFLDSPFVIY